MVEELRICPNCGGKNLTQASRCVHCGLELEDFFRIDGQTEDSVPSLGSTKDDEGLPELLRDLQQPDHGGIFGEGAEQEEKTKRIEPTEPLKPQMPDWLSRVRERAKVEDPSGDLIKKASAVDELKEDSNRVAQEFDAWIARLQESARREAMLKARGVQPSENNDEGVPEWLQRVRELTPKPDEQLTEEVNLTPSVEPTEPKKWESGWSEEDLERLRRGEYQDPEELTKPVDDEPLEHEYPEDEIQTLSEPETEDDQEMASKGFIETSEEPAIEHQISDLVEEVEGTDELFIAALDDEAPLKDEGLLAAPDPSAELDAAEKKVTEGIQPDLLLLKSQHERAELLKALIVQEGKPSFAPKLKQPQRPNLSHVVLAFLLLLGIVGAILFGGSAWPQGQAPKAASVAFATAIDQIKPGDPVLVVFDYQAATSAEVEIGAGEVLKMLLERGANLTLQSTQISGLWLVDSLRQRYGLDNLPEARFVPGGIIGMLSQTLYTPASPAVVPAVAPDSTKIRSMFDYKRILVISDSSISVRDWMDQINSWLPAGTLLFISPQQEAINLSVYYSSGQIGGYLAGIRDYNILGSAAASNETSLPSYRAYQVGMLIMIMMLLLGMVLKADQDADGKVEAEVIES